MTPYRRFLVLGEVLLRLSPPRGRMFVDRPPLDVHVGGSEANVAAALAGLGHGVALATTLPVNALGDTALGALLASGIDCGQVRRVDGRMGLYWVETGAGLRPSEVIYDRAGSTFARTQPTEWDWTAILEGADHLHLSGINVAVGENPTTLALQAIEAANKAAIPISFDWNFRARLWADRDRVDSASILRLAAAAETLFGDYRDVGMLLGRTFDGDTPAGRRAAAEAAFEMFPKLKLMTSTVRRTAHVGEHQLAVRVDTTDHGYETDPIVVPDVVDRVGSGDAFAAGILHSLRHGATLKEIALTGLAMGALKHSLEGDASRISPRQLETFLGGSMDVRR